MKRCLFLILCLCCLLPALADKSAPKSVTFDQSEVYIDLAETDSFMLTPLFEPEGAEATLKWQSGDTSVLTVEDGRVSVYKTGETTVTASVRGNNTVKAECRVTVSDSRVPGHIAVYPSALSLEPSRGAQLYPVCLPDGAGSEVIYSSSNEAAVTVSELGYVTALAPGRSVITVKSAYSDKVYAEVKITSEYLGDIASISVKESSLSLVKDETCCLNVTAAPSESRALVFESGDSAVAAVDENGNVTAVSGGSTIISVYSYRNADIRVSLPVSVYDPCEPETITWSIDGGTLMQAGDVSRLTVALLPETAVTGYTLLSSRPDIVALGADGELTALKKGMSRITIQSVYDENLSADIQIIVEDGTMTLEMPLRSTDESGVSENMGRIEKVKQQALCELNRLADTGSITKKELERRTSIVENAFEMYLFPWTVSEKLKYWKAENSENGVKDFKPGIIYYGLPYNSGESHNRIYNVARALEGRRYIKAEGKEYYIYNLETDDGSYAGNDCSAFVSLALWKGSSYNGVTIKTGDLYYDTRLQKFEDPNELKAGDILVRHSSHVVMFLYWVDEEHTQAVFIQQGGSEPGINTVNTVVEDITRYTEDYYRLRRVVDYKY